MAEVEEPKFTTLAERIAALNQQKNFQAPPPSAGKRPPPPPPPVRTATEPALSNVSAQKSPSVPPRPVRTVTDSAPPLPRRNTEEVEGRRSMAPPPAPSRAAAPPLPTRNSQKQMAPAPELPSRRPSGHIDSSRRSSNSSDISAMSNLSLSDNQTPTRRLPPTLENAKLPPLPPTRREVEAAKKAAEEEVVARSPSLPPRVSRIADPPVPSLPPRLPSRPGKSPTADQTEDPSPGLPARRLPPPPSSYRSKSALEGGFSSGHRQTNGAPPPIPVSSRPSLAQIDAATSRGSGGARPAPTPPSQGSSCMTCRDFSGPDHVAAQFPVANLPRQDVVGYLAHVLCDPFPSPTDKARAIFTWCHHNVAYDIDSFFGNCVRHITPEEAIFDQKAVCSGYAGLYEALALRAGLDCIVVTGHGKGYGYAPMGPGERCPPRKADGHAWNAVRIDGGKWKLIDACWGAGHLGCDNKYSKKFSPEEFIASNEEFGLKHYPEDSAHFFREDGRIPTWEEYYLGPCGYDGEPATFYGSGHEEGLNAITFTPRAKRIKVYSGEVVQFRFSKKCEHWTPEKHGKGKQMLFAIQIHGVDGRKDDLVALDFDGYWWSADIPARDLGCPGQKLSLYGFTSIGNQDARGVTKAEWLRKKGRTGYALCGIAEWELV